MKRHFVAALLAMALPALPMPARAELPRATGTAANPADLETLANFFMPGELLTATLIGSCETVYRTKLSANAGDVKLEHDLPGVHDKMVEAVSASCRRDIPGFIAAHQAAIKADWTRMVRPADIARLAAMMAPSAKEANEHKVEFRQGDTAEQAVNRLGGPTPAEEARLLRAQQAFARTPGGVGLLNQVVAYQSKINAQLTDGTLDGLMPMLKAAFAAGRHAANVYARSKGYGDVYDE